MINQWEIQTNKLARFDSAGNLLKPDGSQASVSGGSLARIQTLLRGSNLLPPRVMASPPTVTMGATGAGPTTATVRIVPWDGVTPQTRTVLNSPYITVYNSSNAVGSRLSATQITMSSQEKFQFATPIMPTNAGNQVMMCLSFFFSGQVFEIAHYGNLGIYGMSNGDAFSDGVQNLEGSGARWSKFTFADASPRNIVLYLFGAVGSLAVGGNDTVAPFDRSSGINAVFHGDSFFQTAGLRMPSLGPAGEAMLRAGIPNAWGAGYGGAGYLAAGSTNAASQALPDLLAVAKCDLWHTSLGINDSRTSAVTVFDGNVANYFAAIRATFPAAVISATAGWAPTESFAQTAEAIGKAAAIKAGLQSVAGPWIFVDNLTGNWANSSGVSGRNAVASTSSTTSTNGGPSVNTGAQSPGQAGAWITGQGKVGSPTGKGNADIYTSADGTHPSPAGVSYLGAMLAMGWRDAILAM